MSPSRRRCPTSGVPITPESKKLAEADEGIKPAWEAFLAASEVLDTVACYQRLRAACGVKEGAYGREAFDAVLQPTVVSTALASVGLAHACTTYARSLLPRKRKGPDNRAAPATP